MPAHETSPIGVYERGDKWIVRTNVGLEKAQKREGRSAYSKTPAGSVTFRAASAALGLSAGSPISLLYDFPEVFFVLLSAFPFRASLGFHLVVAHHGACGFFR